jgi:hypothetical protein
MPSILLEEAYARRESRLWQSKCDPLLTHNPFAVEVSRRHITVIGFPDSCLSGPTDYRQFDPYQDIQLNSRTTFRSRPAPYPVPL